MSIDDKYSHMDERTMFGFLANAMDGGGDKGRSFPYSDAEDLSRGLRFIPGEVTLARREGTNVPFIQACTHPCCWHWQFPNGSRTYYFEQGDYLLSEGSACPECGNTHRRGGRVAAHGEEQG